LIARVRFMTNTAEYPMSESSDAELLSACQLEIERAWNEAKDDGPVHRLAADHPELAEELYEFFACVIEAEDELDRPRPDFAEMDRRVRAMLGVAEEDAAVKAQPSFLALVRGVTGESVDAIAVGMEVTADFLVVASEEGKVVPVAARVELVRRARGLRNMGDVNESELMVSFDAPPSLRRAASRRTAFTPSTVTYDMVVKHSTMSDESKRFWLGLGVGPELGPA
jgi:hypothetical protein